jgi:hypothetical protein
MTTGELTCCYCGKVVSNQRSKSAHEVRCLSGPDVGGKVYAFMHEHAENGVAPSTRHYDQIRGNLPSAEKIAKQAGSWSGYIESIGLKVAPTLPVSRLAVITPKRGEPIPDNGNPTRDFSALAAMHDWRERERTFGARVYREMYTVLR